jgi:hypothetical protein
MTNTNIPQSHHSPKGRFLAYLRVSTPKAIDPEQGPLVRLAFTWYATGKYSLRTPLSVCFFDLKLRSRGGGKIAVSGLPMSSPVGEISGKTISVRSSCNDRQASQRPLPYVPQTSF